jgi:hypothetical protein
VIRFVAVDVLDDFGAEGVLVGVLVGVGLDVRLLDGNGVLVPVGDGVVVGEDVLVSLGYTLSDCEGLFMEGFGVTENVNLLERVVL